MTLFAGNIQLVASVVVEATDLADAEQTLVLFGENVCEVVRKEWPEVVAGAGLHGIGVNAVSEITEVTG